MYWSNMDNPDGHKKILHNIEMDIYEDPNLETRILYTIRTFPPNTMFKWIINH